MEFFILACAFVGFGIMSGKRWALWGLKVLGPIALLYLAAYSIFGGERAWWVAMGMVVLTVIVGVSVYYAISPWEQTCSLTQRSSGPAGSQLLLPISGGGGPLNLDVRPHRDVRYQGHIVEWKDDRGFGFIIPNGGGAKVFLHISEFADHTLRPTVGTLVTYELSAGKDGRGRANRKFIPSSGCRVRRHPASGCHFRGGNCVGLRRLGAGFPPE